MKPFSLPNKFILAPMAGISDAAFREQCRKYGAALTVTELTSVEGIVRKEKELQDVLDVLPNERPAVQLFGNDINNITRAAKIVEPFASVIDFNIGCPAPHITAQDAGSALLMKPDHLHKIFSSLVGSVNIPVTAKIRLGPNDNQLVFKEVAKTLEDADCSMITLHPRTVQQGYSGKADWSKIKELVKLVNIPVCGNGDVTTPEEAKKMLEETGCAYVMIGRAAAGNPFLFQQCNEYLATGSYKEVSEEQRREAFIEYADLAVKYGVKNSRIRGMAMQFTRGLSGAKKIREQIAKVFSIDELKNLFLQK